MDSIAVTRRFALRMIGGALLAAPAGLAVREAKAGISWCRSDPVIELKTPNEHFKNSASIYLAAALEDYEANNSSGSIVIEHPKDAKTKKLWEDPRGYFGQGVSTNFAINESLRFLGGYMEVRVRCYIPASRNNMAIRLEWAPGPIQFVNGWPQPAPVIAAAEGYGNQWITLSSVLPYA